MPEEFSPSKPDLPASAQQLLAQVALRQSRMIRRKQRGAPDVWRAIALVGVIGWVVVLPMVAGIAMGMWIDRRWPSRFSWTLMLLVAGLGAGCFHAWDRIKREQKEDH